MQSTATPGRLVRLGPLTLPGEGGVYGVWLSSLAYGLAGLRAGSALANLSALAGSALSLLLLERARRGSLLAVAVVGLAYAPALAAGWPSSALTAAAALALLPAAYKGRGLRGVIAGGALLAVNGGIVRSIGNPLDYVGVLAPVAYALLTVTHAAAVVTRQASLFAAEEAAAYAAVAALAWGWAAGGETVKAAVVALDAAGRALLLHSGAYYRVKVKIYGFHEFLHSLTVMILLGAA